MSRWNVEPKQRTEMIVVKKILQRWPEYTADFPGMEILDQKGRKHRLAALDFHSFDEWDQIQAGSIIELTFTESIVNPRVLPMEMVSVVVQSPTWGEKERANWLKFRTWVENMGGKWVEGMEAHEITFVLPKQVVLQDQGE